jgi:WD40 repeat protein
MISAGLDGTVKLWDLRNLGKKKKHQALAEYHGKRSISSAFFSPSGQYVVATTMSNKLDLLNDFHLSSSNNKTTTPSIVKPWKSLTHDNQTGRWLSTLMARFHPSLDIFCVGSMQQPRRVEIFSPYKSLLRGVEGDALTAVPSRCCFHPSTDRLIVVGGNSSGRVTIVR